MGNMYMLKHLKVQCEVFLALLFVQLYTYVMLFFWLNYNPNSTSLKNACPTILTFTVKYY